MSSNAQQVKSVRISKTQAALSTTEVKSLALVKEQGSKEHAQDSKIHQQGSKIHDQGSKIHTQASKIQEHGSKTLEHGSKVQPSKSIIKLRPKSTQMVYTKSDSSIYPSYTNLALPYRVMCRQRYQNAIKKHQAQFIKEIRLHERLQPCALGGVRLRREFCDPVLKKVSQKDIITLTLDQERRLEYILKTDPRELQS